MANKWTKNHWGKWFFNRSFLVCKSLRTIECSILSKANYDSKTLKWYWTVELSECKLESRKETEYTNSQQPLYVNSAFVV
jgi:hypothetical protein